MPYIKGRDKAELSVTFESRDPVTSGELNYVLTTVIRDYFFAHPNYQGINDIVGALEGAKLEFYRRIAAPYEDVKIKENGDVY